MQPHDGPNPTGREIRNVALLDLTGAQAASALEGVTRIAHVATILVPESLLPKLSSIPMEQVAATIPIPDGRRVRVFSGQITLSAEALAKPGGVIRARPGGDLDKTGGNLDKPGSETLAKPGGDQGEMLVVVGQLIITSPVQTVGYTDLIVQGQVVAPAGSETALGAGLTRLTGQVVYYPYPEGATIRMLSGNAISGEALANASGQPTEILLVTGQLVVTGPIQRLGFQQVVALGHVVVPQDTDASLLGRLTALGGRVVTYTATPRVFDGKDRFSGAFFELLEEPITLVLDGSFTFDDDVAPDLVRRKVTSLILKGKLRAPRRLVPLLQVLCIARQGRIVASDEPD